MADFLLPERTVTLELDRSFMDWAGAEIVVRTSLPFAVYAHIAEILAKLAEGGAAGLEEAMALFIAEGRPRWNLADADGPVPATVDGMREHLEPRVIGTILRAWLEQVGEVPSPLGAPSSAGAPSAAGSAKPRRRSSSRP